MPLNTAPLIERLNALDQIGDFSVTLTEHSYDYHTHLYQYFQNTAQSDLPRTHKTLKPEKFKKCKANLENVAQLYLEMLMGD